MRLTDHADIEVIEVDDCRRLLGASEVGRLAVSVGGSPEIFPVNYAVTGDLVVIRSRSGTKVHAARGGRACLEIDSFDTVARSGWSVVAKGRLEEVTVDEARAWARATEATPQPWAGGDRPHVLCLHVDRITGRRVGGPAQSRY